MRDRPYDRTIWSKVRDPWFYVFTFVSASPVVWVRGGFFTIYLLCIASDREEFQVDGRPTAPQCQSPPAPRVEIRISGRITR